VAYIRATQPTDEVNRGLAVNDDDYGDCVDDVFEQVLIARDIFVVVNRD